MLAVIERDQERYLDELKDYLRIPSISTEPEYQGEVRRCAEFVLEKLLAAGLDARLIETEGHPLVYGEWCGAPGKPTILFYGHYDVQPADPLELWRSPPFEPTVEGDHLVARGATDDKGQSFAHLKAVEAMLGARGELPVNVKFLIEGEEESGGESIEKFVVQDAGEQLGCDVVVVSDSSMFGPGQPSILYGLKGMLYLEVEVRGPGRDLHSGSFGGAVANPVNALCAIVASLRSSATGRIEIPGFYDRVCEPEAWERESFAALSFDEEAYRKDLGVPEVWGEDGYSTLERAWVRPTCDVNGIWGGYRGSGAKTVLPAAGTAKISMRLVPDQDPLEIESLFRAHVEAQTPPGVHVEVRRLHYTSPVIVDVEGPFIEVAMEAMTQVWGARPVKVREGGSIPIVSTFTDVLRAPVVLIGFGLADDRLHSPNEKFNISHFYNGIRSIARLLDLLGAR